MKEASQSPQPEDRPSDALPPVEFEWKGIKLVGTPEEPTEAELDSFLLLLTQLVHNISEREKKQPNIARKDS